MCVCVCVCGERISLTWHKRILQKRAFWSLTDRKPSTTSVVATIISVVNTHSGTLENDERVYFVVFMSESVCSSKLHTSRQKDSSVQKPIIICMCICKRARHAILSLLPRDALFSVSRAYYKSHHRYKSFLFCNFIANLHLTCQFYCCIRRANR